MSNSIQPHLRIVGIETSCDETGVAVYDTHEGLLGYALFSQIDLHKMFGGVIPEISSRSQLEKIEPVLRAALSDAHTDIANIDVIAVTNRPGLPGSLLVGVCFAKGMAYGSDKKIIGINHIEGHIFSVFLEHIVPFPHLCLTVSGGHTSLFFVESFGMFTEIATTRDDAAGEAFDKIAKMLDLGYPGGPIMEQYARHVNFVDFFSYPRGTHGVLAFSFSGLKTAVLYDLIKRGVYDRTTKRLVDTREELKEQVASSVHVCMADIFIEKLSLAYRKYPQVQAVTFVGGVACNRYIRSRIQSWAEERAMNCFAPSAKFCTDNGAMIAFVGAYKAQQGLFSSLDLDILTNG